MSPEYNMHEWIDRYLSGEMSEVEKSKFQAKLEKDADFAQTFEAQKVAHRIVVGKELMALKAQMARDLSGGTNYGYSRPWKYIASGTIIVAVSIIVYLLLSNSKSEGNKTGDRKKLYPHDTVVFDSGKLNKPDTSNTDNTTNNLQEQKNVKAPEKIYNDESICSDTMISFSCQARGACDQGNEGAIEIDVNTIKSGVPPFAFSVTPYGAFQAEPVITDLKPGKYNLYVKDSEKCLRKLNVKVEVPELKCDHMLK